MVENKYYKILIAVAIIFWGNVFSQDKISFSGYLSGIGQSTFNTDSAKYDATVHNRLNFKYYANDNFTISLEARNQFIFGESVQNTKNYAENYGKDKGWVDMNFNWFNNSDNFLNTQVDRAYIEYIKGSLEICVGRQRINWGRSFVWNPNDLFNAYSYYDFDYMERPGSDAIRIQYYTGMASSIELVTKIDSNENITVAGLAKINKWGYDIQFLAGYANSEDFVMGTGWEGNIKAVALRGEVSYYHPEKEFNDTVGSFLATVSADYLLPKDISAQIEFLYNDSKTKIDLSNPNVLLTAPANSKTLSFSEFNFYGNLSWQATPILTLNTAAMYYPDYNGFFLMPGIDLSIKDNLYLSAIYQYMSLNIEVPGFGNEIKVGSNLAFLRLKWNF